jgi:hypothetical protein
MPKTKNIKADWVKTKNPNAPDIDFFFPKKIKNL